MKPTGLASLTKDEWSAYSSWDYLLAHGDDIAEKAIRLLKKNRWFGSYTQDREDIRSMLGIMLVEGLQRVINDNRNVAGMERDFLLASYTTSVIRTQFLRQYRTLVDTCGSELNEDRESAQMAIGRADHDETPLGLGDPLLDIVRTEDEAEARMHRHRALEAQRHNFTCSQFKTARELYVDELPASFVSKHRGVTEQTVRVCVRTMVKRAQRLSAKKKRRTA